MAPVCLGTPPIEKVKVELGKFEIAVKFTTSPVQKVFPVASEDKLTTGTGRISTRIPSETLEHPVAP